MSLPTSPRARMHGGINPPGNKQQSLRHPIRRLPLPPQLIVPVQQRGEPLPELLIGIGDRVEKGQCLARGRGERAVSSHAPAAGVVTDIGAQPLPDDQAGGVTCVTIATEPCVASARCLPPLDPVECGNEMFLQRLRDAGITGLGGAGFPTHAKVRAAIGRVETLIVNATECEPFITADAALLQERAADVLRGASLLLQITGATRCLVGIQDDAPAAIASLQAAMTDARFQLCVLPARYPHGAEALLVHVLTGREVPMGRPAIDYGVLCHNPATLHAVARAVLHGEPLISRVMTLTGAALRDPGNYDVLIGTPVAVALQACGLDEWQHSRSLAGGPLLGVELQQATVPLIKTSNCILATTEAELPRPPPSQPCIRCGLCADVCPVRLLPQQLHWFWRSGELDKAASHHLEDCIDCGACAYVCPSTIPLVQQFRLAKTSLAEQRARQRQADRARERFEAHQARVATQQRLDEQRRRERAALLQRKQAEAAARTETVNAVTASSAPSPQDVIAAALARVQARKAAKRTAEPTALPPEGEAPP